MLPNSKSDVYSFGMTLYHALAGVSPYSDITSDEELRTCKLAREPPSRNVRCISDGAWELIRQCCDPVPSQRPTMERVSNALKSLAAELSTVNSTKIAVPEGKDRIPVLVNAAMDIQTSKDTVDDDHVLVPISRDAKKLSPEHASGTPVKSRGTPKSYKLRGAVVLAIVVVVAVVIGIVVVLKPFSASSNGSSTGSGSATSSSAGSDSSAAGTTSSSSANSASSTWSSTTDSSTGSSSTADPVPTPTATSTPTPTPTPAPTPTAALHGLQVSLLITSDISTSMGIIGLWGIARASNGDIYVADSFRILQVTEGSSPVEYAGNINRGYQNGDLLSARFASLGAMAFAPNGDLFVCDSDMVRQISSNSVSTFAALSPSRLHDIAVDSGGNVYVTDERNTAVTKITSTGSASTFATVNLPRGITIDSADNVYVTDKNRILKFTAAGSMSVVAGSTAFGSVNAVGESASFYSPARWLSARTASCTSRTEEIAASARLASRRER